MKIALVLAGLLPVAFAQPKAADPAFEVASIQLSPPMGNGAVFTGIRGGPGSQEPLRATFMRYRLAGLIAFAYDLKPYQFDRNDARLQRDDFDIQVSLPEGATREEFRAMLRTLLAERFHLRVHWETKAMDVFDLVQAPGGHKLKPPTVPGEARPIGALEKDAENLPVLQPGRSMEICAFAGCRMQRVGENLDSLVIHLAAELNAPVRDATGLSGRFDYAIGWGSSAPNRAADAPAPLVTAITEQLGLRVEKRKGEAEILMVDSVDRLPTAN